MRPARPLALIVISHAPFLAAVHLHVGGVNVDGDWPAAGQLAGPLGGQQRQHPGGRGRQARLGACPLRCGEPAGQPGRGRGSQAGHRRDLLASGIGALTVQADQEILPGQLRRGDPGQHLPTGEPAVALLDRRHVLIEGLDQAELDAQFGDRDHPASRCQRRIRCPDLDPAAHLVLFPWRVHHTGDTPC